MKHPLEKFHYCPVCGSSQFSENDFKSKRCGACGFVYYANPAASTAAFITRGDCLLVARRGKAPAEGTLDLPGGFIDMGETVVQGLHREIMEETGLRVESATWLFSLPNVYMFSGMGIHTIDLFFEVSVSADAEPQAADDAAELMWMPIAEVDASLFGLKSISQGVGRWLASRSGGITA